MTATDPRPLAPSVARSGGHRIWLLLSAACLVPAVLDTLQAYGQARLSGEPARWQNLLFQGLEWLFLGALLPITYLLARRFPLDRTRWRRTLGVHFVGALALCVAWASLGVALGSLLDRYPEGNYLSWILTSVPWSVFMYFTVLGCVYAFTYFNEAREREAHAARLSAQLSEARLGALRMQLHPHFLFNSLNALSVLVRERNTAAASRMLELLGDVLRQVLRSDHPHEVPLADELSFLEQYLAIEQVRFSDRLRVSWSIEERARTALVPGFVLQPLVENAIKHGVAKRAEAGRIDISARVVGDRLELSVRDDGVGMSPSQPEGVGLSNTRDRLRTLYGENATLAFNTPIDGGTEVVLTIPYRVATA
ncbi:MAG TPA: histidine kinase [Gemmatimonadaceae bacterium]|nr:histidine kinase [Gemmatimonadaceae bacterium]